MKLKLKLLIATLALFLIICSTNCFATGSDYGTMLISADSALSQESTITNSDLYVSDSKYEISNTVNGNAFILADKFILKQEVELNGDLYICANEVILEQKSKINGNAFICSNNTTINGEINGSIYAVSQKFDMQYFAFISRDLHLTAEEAALNGWIYRDSFISAKNITTQENFINQNNFTLSDADSLTFSGEILGDATINTKDFIIKNTDNEKNLTCKISGNLSYSSNKELDIQEGIVSKEIKYSNYVDTEQNNTFSNIWNYVLSLITSLVCVYIIYLLISKFAPKYLDKISNISGLNLLKSLGIGLALLILIPIVSILLFITQVGSILGIILLLIYIILLIIAKPLFIISIATFAKSKFTKGLNIYLYILFTTVALSIISLIPYIGFIISMLVFLIGLGMLVKR